MGVVQQKSAEACIPRRFCSPTVDPIRQEDPAPYAFPRADHLRRDSFNL